MITCKNNNKKKHTHTQTKQRQKNTKHKQGTSQLFPEKESRVTAAFQGGAFSPFPPGSNWLFSSLDVLCLRFSGVVAAVEEMSASVAVLLVLARVSPLSVGDEMFPPWLEPMPAVKKPEAVVRPWSHVLSFGEHCCRGVSRPVSADGDLSSPRSGSILPSVFFSLTLYT